MHKQFVTHEISLKLKELGFNKPCIAKYCRYNPSDKMRLFPQGQNSFKGSGFDYCTNKEYKKEEKTAAPLWQQAIDWIREVHNLKIDVSEICDGTNAWHYAINLEWSFTHSDYYKAREMAILKAIQLIKEK